MSKHPLTTQTKFEILIFSGAGLSQESGLSTFRQAEGLWDNHDINRVCNEWTWREHRSEVHDFYNHLRHKLAESEPNEAHHCIARMQQNSAFKVTVITQNVDDLLERAGCNKVLHVHGKLTELECTDCGHVWDIGYNAYSDDVCPVCHSAEIRPNIVFFNGQAPHYPAMYEQFDRIGRDSENVIVAVGSSGQVLPYSHLTGSHHSAEKILVNFDPLEQDVESLFNRVMHEKASLALPELELEWILDRT